MSKLNQNSRPLGSQKSWAKTPGTYIAAHSHIDGVDATAMAMEQKWGAGRLRLLVSPELREKFDRQRYLWNQAIWHGDLESIRVQSARMTSAWKALDGAAVAAGALKLDPVVWEVTLEDGRVAAIVRTYEEAHDVIRQNRAVITFSLDEIGRMISNYPAVLAAKSVFPGATVEAVRRPADPLNAIRDSSGGLDDPIDDPLPDLGV
jgi:hypothetical protein